jgi:hypothetical protein
MKTPAIGARHSWAHGRYCVDRCPLNENQETNDIAKYVEEIRRVQLHQPIRPKYLQVFVAKKFKKLQMMCASFS